MIFEVGDDEGEERVAEDGVAKDNWMVIEEDNLEEDCDTEQVPKSGLHLAPQCPLVVPHHPY